MVTNDEFNGCGMQMRAERERLLYERQAAERPTSLHGILAAIRLGEKNSKGRCNW